MTPPPHIRRWLMAILAAALAIRLTWCVLAPASTEHLEKLPDQLGYLELGQNLLHGQGLKWRDPRFEDDTYATRMPGYPLLVAACGGQVMLIRIVQTLLDTSTVLATFFVARRWLPAAAALLAALAIAFNPFLIYFCATILSETLFTALLAWAAVLLTAPISLAWGGLLLALGILVKPSAIALPVVFGIAGALVNHQLYRRPQRRWSPHPGALMLLLTLLCLLPWAIRNRAVLKQWIWTNTNSGFVLFDGLNPHATGASDQSRLSSLEWNAALRGLDEVQRNEALAAYAKQWLIDTWRENPRHVFRLILSKIARTWSPIPLSAEFGARPLYKFAAGGFAIPFYALVLVGLFKSPLPGMARLFLLTPAIYFTVMHAATVGSLRYRVPTEPILATLAAAGVIWLFEQLRTPTWKRHSISR